jgi:hypothetical protein
MTYKWPNSEITKILESGVTSTENIYTQLISGNSNFAYTATDHGLHVRKQIEEIKRSRGL